MKNCKTLFISNRNDVTTDYLISKFKSRSNDFLRINSEDINKIDIDFNQINGTTIVSEDICYKINQVQSVYYRRAPTIYDSNDDVRDKPYLINERRHFFEGIYLAIGICKWINPMFNTYAGERKLMQLSLANKLGLLTPKTLVTNKLANAISFLEINKDCIVKPISHGLQQRGDEFYSIYTTQICLNDLLKLNLTEYFDTPLFLQEKISNKSDIRVTIVGETIFAVSIVKNNSEDVDWRRPEIDKEYNICKLPINIEKKLLQLNKSLGLIYSAIDLILSPNGDYYFLEINPVGEWGWLENEVGCNISDLLIKELLCLE